MSQHFAWGGQSTGVSASASFPPKKSQGRSPSEWTGWISLQSKGLSRVFSNTTVQKHQFFGAQLYSCTNFVQKYFTFYALLNEHKIPSSSFLTNDPPHPESFQSLLCPNWTEALILDSAKFLNHCCLFTPRSAVNFSNYLYLSTLWLAASGSISTRRGALHQWTCVNSSLPVRGLFPTHHDFSRACDMTGVFLLKSGAAWLLWPWVTLAQPRPLWLSLLYLFIDFSSSFPLKLLLKHEHFPELIPASLTSLFLFFFSPSLTNSPSSTISPSKTLRKSSIFTWAFKFNPPSPGWRW